MRRHSHVRFVSHGRPERVSRHPAGRCRQILLLDVVFRLDSVITTTGVTDEITVMVLAIVIAAGPISRFVEQHPSAKIPAPSFLLLIGMRLIAKSLGQRIAKGYPSFAMRLSVFTEMVNLRGHGSEQT